MPAIAGRSLYRKGDYRGSIEANEAIEKADGVKNSFISAMAHWRLGEMTEARAVFEGVNKWLKDYDQQQVYLPTAQQRLQNALAEIACEFGVAPGHALLAQQKRLQAEAAAMLNSAPAGPVQGSETKQDPKP